MTTNRNQAIKDKERSEKRRRGRMANSTINYTIPVSGSNSGPEESLAFNSGSVGSSNSGLGISYTSTFSALGGPGASGPISDIFSGGQGAYDCGDDS
jgi:hypothetical protein